MNKADEDRINKVLTRAIKESKMAIDAFDIQMRKMQDLTIKATDAGKNLKEKLDMLVKEMEKEKTNAKRQGTFKI